MNIKEIKVLVAQGESDKVEFKTSTAQLKEAAMSLCAFLNLRGGYVFIGVNNKGELIGQDVSDNTRQEIARELNKIEPPVHFDVDYITLKNSKYIICIHAPAGTHAPYIYDGRPFQRNQSSTFKMSQHQYEQLLVKRGQLNYAWEEELAEDSTFDSLDHDEIYRMLNEGIRENRIPASAIKDNIQQLLVRLKLAKEGKLKRAAVVLFAREEALHYPQCMIKLARFKGTDKLGDFIDNQRGYGNAFQILALTDIFIRRHLPIASFFKPDQLERIDVPALPVLAVREALINAICHRDYANRSASISVAIYDDRLEIWNNGALPDHLKIEDLRRQHDSLPRNKLIAEIFYIRGLIESWGTGTNKMISLCQQNNIPEPEFEEYSGGLAVVFKFKEKIMQGKIIKLKPSALSEFLKDLPKRQQEIVILLSQTEELTAAQILEQLQAPPAQRTLRDDLATLKKLGVINSRGHARSARWYLQHKQDNH